MTFVRALILMVLACVGTVPAAAQQVTPFLLVGQVENFRLDPGGDPRRGGRIRVNGIEVTLPTNVIVQTPTRFFTAPQFFALNPIGPTTESGIAIEDGVKPLGAYEAQITGNIVAGRYVGALVLIAQVSLSSGNGYIRAIAPDGTMTIDVTPPGTPPTRPTLVRLNDPAGRFGRASAGTTMDKRFAVDDEAASVTASTGFPVCVPGAGVPACFAGNRPAGDVDRFVMGAAPPPVQPGFPPIAPCPTCRADRLVPLRVGDHVTYAGVLARGGPSTSFVAAYALVAELGIYTMPGSPAYLSVEQSLIGTMGPRRLRATQEIAPIGTPDTQVIPQETKDRLRVVGFTTDPSRTVSIYAIDVNPGSGTERLRRIGRIVPEATPLGRWRYLVGKRAGALAGSGGVRGAPRELLIRVDDGQDMEGRAVPTGPLVANGLVRGQYRTPVGAYLFPENTAFGDRLVPNNFECLAFLQVGWRLDGLAIGRLSPWPGLASSGPGPVSCGP